MATNETIQRMLERIASNYSKHERWVTDNAPTWTHSLKGYPDKLVIMACKKWIAEHTRAPNIANLRGIIAGFPSRTEAPKPKGCLRCDGNGQVEVAHHKSSKSGKASSCTVYAAGCMCAAGAVLCAGAYQPWEVFVDALRADPFTLAVYHSTPENPYLSERERWTPEQLQQRESRERANLGSSGFRHIR